MQQPRVKLIFVLLVTYVLFQFLWWTYLIFDLNAEIAELKSQLLNLDQNIDTSLQRNLLAEKLKSKRLMILGEGSVFLAILVFGVYQIYKSVKKQTELNLQQTNFMLSITHELKTPLASTRLQLETLLKRELPKEKQEKILSNAINDTDRLHNLIENILLASRVDSKHFIIHKEEIELTEYIHLLLSKSNVFSGNKERIVFNATDKIYAQVDKLAFSSVLINLIDNALKYSSDHVNVSVQPQANGFVLTVSDRGEGISESDKQIVFNKFYRTGSEETRKTKGTGLGLYIVKKLVEAHEGTVSIENNSPKGTKVIVKI
jgi:two-component system phosphate regulon sensor histidine kinase PhoR